MRVFADTSGLYAYLDAADPRNGSAVASFREMVDRRAQLVTHDYVIVELLALTQRRLGRIAAAGTVESLLAPIEIRWVTPSLHAEAMAAFRDSERNASFVDQMSFAVMRSEQLTTAFAFDDDFQKAGFTTVP